MKWSSHPVAHLRKVAIAYKKELAIGAVSKMKKADLIVLLDKHLILGDDGKISIKGSPTKSLDIKIEEPIEKKKPSEKKQIVKIAEELKEVEKKKEEPKKTEKKIITWEDIRTDANKTIPLLQARLINTIVSRDGITAKEIFNSLNELSENWKLDNDLLGTDKIAKLSKKLYDRVIVYLIFNNYTTFDNVINKLIETLRTKIPKKDIEKYDNFFKNKLIEEKEKRKTKEEPKKEEPKKEEMKKAEPKKEEPTKSVYRQGKGITKEEVINEWDTPIIGTVYSQYLLSQKDTKQAESLLKWVENKNKKEMPIFDDLGLTFTKEFNDAVFEKYGRDVLFEGLRRILRSFDANKVVDMDKPPIQRTIKGMNLKNTKILQAIEDKKK